jgi:hypothetical protein
MEEKFPEMVSSWRDLVYDGVKLTSKEKEALVKFMHDHKLEIVVDSRRSVDPDFSSLVQKLKFMF